jgi:hypothetical protein
VALAFDIRGISLGSASNTNMPMMINTTSTSLSDKAVTFLRSMFPELDDFFFMCFELTKNS